MRDTTIERNSASGTTKRRWRECIEPTNNMYWIPLKSAIPRVLRRWSVVGPALLRDRAFRINTEKFKYIYKYKNTKKQRYISRMHFSPRCISAQMDISYNAVIVYRGGAGNEKARAFVLIQRGRTSSLQRVVRISRSPRGVADKINLRACHHGVLPRDLPRRLLVLVLHDVHQDVAHGAGFRETSAGARCGKTVGSSAAVPRVSHYRFDRGRICRWCTTSLRRNVRYNDGTKSPLMDFLRRQIARRVKRDVHSRD